MDKFDKRKFALAGGAAALLALSAMPGPVANIRITHDTTGTTISKVEATVNLGVMVVSFLHSWTTKRTFR